MTREENDFIIETLDNAIEWAEYAPEYFKKKHKLDDDLLAVESCKDILRQSRTCENCKHYQPITRNGTLFKRCFFLGTVGDIITCGRWEQK